jgi:putative endonuclease
MGFRALRDLRSFVVKCRARNVHRPARHVGGRTAIARKTDRTRYGEIDIIASSGPSLVFIEVKARDGHEFGGGEAAVTVYKQQRIVRMAIDFLARRRLQDRPCRFDVVTVDFTAGEPRIEVYPHAFTA